MNVYKSNCTTAVCSVHDVSLAGSIKLWFDCKIKLWTFSIFPPFILDFVIKAFFNNLKEAFVQVGCLGFSCCSVRVRVPNLSLNFLNCLSFSVPLGTWSLSSLLMDVGRDTSWRDCQSITGLVFPHPWFCYRHSSNFLLACLLWSNQLLFPGLWWWIVHIVSYMSTTCPTIATRV